MPTELRAEYMQRETVFDKYIDSCITSDIKNLIIKEEWFMLEEMREKYVAKLQELEAQDIEILVQTRLKDEEEKIRQEVVAEHNDKILLAKLKVQAVDEMIADQAEELHECDREDRENMEV